MIELRFAQLRVRLGVEAVVAVGDVDRQHAPDVRIVDGDAFGSVPAAILAEQVHVVAQAREGPHQAGVVDVASGAPEQISVEDQYAHRRRLFQEYRQLSFRAHARPPEVSTASPLRPRDHPRGRGRQALRRSRDGRGAQGGERGASAGRIAERAALLRRQPAPVRMLAGAARPEGPERLPSLRPAAAGRRALTARLAALALLLAALAAIGCGGDDESSADPPPTAPELTIPTTTPTDPPTTTETTPTTEDTVPPPTEGDTTETTPAPPADTPENDTPPPADTPAERFEDFCND